MGAPGRRAVVVAVLLEQRSCARAHHHHRPPSHTTALVPRPQPHQPVRRGGTHHCTADRRAWLRRLRAALYSCLVVLVVLPRGVPLLVVLRRTTTTTTTGCRIYDYNDDGDATVPRLPNSTAAEEEEDEKGSMTLLYCITRQQPAIWFLLCVLLAISEACCMLPLSYTSS